MDGLHITGDPDALVEHIPGGIHHCLDDGHFTLVSMSAGFLTLLGYTRAQIKAQFNDRFLDMILPADCTRVLEETERQLLHGDTLELEYRVRRGDRSQIWILDKGQLVVAPDGKRSFYCMLVDITQRRREQEELRLSLERHQVIMDQTTDIIFVWDIPGDTLEYSSNWNKKFGYDPISKHIHKEIPNSAHIHPDDMRCFIKIMGDTAQGVPYSEAEFRILHADGGYFWNRIRATTQYDADGAPIRAVGVILDIDEEKSRTQRLWELTQRDALTGLYNKMAVQALAERLMCQAEKHPIQMLAMIDIDNFKAVNDTYGHLAGDALLTAVAGVLREMLRTSDLTARVGGDEFLVFLPELGCREAAESKAQALLEALGKLCPKQDAPPITCSIGVALSSAREADYLTLYQNADQALYEVKARGKAGYAIYAPAPCSDGSHQ